VSWKLTKKNPSFCQTKEHQLKEKEQDIFPGVESLKNMGDIELLMPKDKRD
jgi:hypothetical protein